MIIKKTNSSLDFPLIPSKIVEEKSSRKLLHYATTGNITPSPYLQDFQARSTSSFSTERKEIEKILATCLHRTPENLCKLVLEEYEKIMRRVATLPGVMKILPETRFAGFGHNEWRWDPTGSALFQANDNLKGYLKILKNKFFIGFNEDSFIDGIILTARMELDLYTFGKIYLADCKKLGLPPPELLENELLEELTPKLNNRTTMTLNPHILANNWNKLFSRQTSFISTDLMEPRLKS